MSIHEFYPPLPEVVADSALTALQRWARERPTQIALRHRRLGAWKAWRWIDVQREVERVADGLRQQGFTPGARLALSGAFEPSLLILALAAQQLGGQNLVIGRDSRGDELQRLLRHGRPAFAFVQRRENVSHWLGSGLVEYWPLRLFFRPGQCREQWLVAGAATVDAVCRRGAGSAASGLGAGGRG